MRNRHTVITLFYKAYLYLHDEDDDAQYRMYSDVAQRREGQASASVSTALQLDFRPHSTGLRCGLTLELAVAQLRSHPSPWMPEAWSLDAISLSHGNSPAGIMVLDTPHVTPSIDNLTPTTSERSPRDETF
ncbi:hypothetical protein KC332_g787 [Hortaea werneckii]|nr:hypothetical protein KC358_g759 [Hortaea werneckii]KAI6852740.1 hypothetical protein KC350_g606 [Hortaea werneckii]KAI6944545.1 hypothetical protein KC341_g759 [Hortaea werneckii]KAI6947736.1 hypothetical protein KC348_g2377 [Hortaea werneckii]KAI6982393.1 hypothetical protein KC321_g673 [Hortaea werneckii]